MIFITLGTQPCDFSRCLKMVEDLIKIKDIEDDVLAQTGYTSYHPQGVKCVDFLSEDKFQQCIESASIVISHAGAGALFSSIKKRKKIIAVARLKDYGEMIDNHQLELVKKLSQGGYIIDGTSSLLTAWEQVDLFTPRPYDFINDLPKFIKGQIDMWLCNTVHQSY